MGNKIDYYCDCMDVDKKKKKKNENKNLLPLYKNNLWLGDFSFFPSYNRKSTWITSSIFSFYFEDSSSFKCSKKKKT